MATNNDGIFHRRVKNPENKPSNVAENEGMPTSKSSSDKKETGYRENKLHSGTYWLTRIVFLRSLAFVYCKLVNIGVLCSSFARSNL